MIRQRPKENPLTEFAMASLDAAAAYKDEAIQRGFTPEAAEALAVTFHSVMMASVYEEGVDNPPSEV